MTKEPHRNPLRSPESRSASEPLPSNAKQETRDAEVLVEAETTYQELTASSFSGPIPPPSMIQEFDRVYPGAAKIIFDDFSKRAAHQRDMERMYVIAEIEDMRAKSRLESLGYYCAFGSLLAILITGTLLISLGSGWTQAFGGVLATGSLVGVVRAFLTQKPVAPDATDDAENVSPVQD